MNYFSFFRDYLQYRLKAKDEYSIHSPYMFDFFTKGLKAKMSNKAFKELKRSSKATRGDLSCLQSRLRHKNNVFVARISAYFKPKRILIISDWENNTSLYLSTVLPQSDIVQLGRMATMDSVENVSNFDFIYLDIEENSEQTKARIDELIPYCNPNAILVFGNTATNNQFKEIWTRFQEDERFKVTADFFLCKVIFLTQNPMKKQHYCLLTK